MSLLPSAPKPSVNGLAAVPLRAECPRPQGGPRGAGGRAAAPGGCPGQLPGACGEHPGASSHSRQKYAGILGRSVLGGQCQEVPVWELAESPHLPTAWGEAGVTAAAPVKAAAMGLFRGKPHHPWHIHFFAF